MATPLTPKSETFSILTTDYLSTSQVASLLGVTKWTLAGMRVKRSGPPFVMLRRGIVRYSSQALQSFLRMRAQSAASTPGRRRVARMMENLKEA